MKDAAATARGEQDGAQEEDGLQAALAALFAPPAPAPAETPRLNLNFCGTPERDSHTAAAGEILPCSGRLPALPYLSTPVSVPDEQAADAQAPPVDGILTEQLPGFRPERPTDSAEPAPPSSIPMDAPSTSIDTRPERLPEPVADVWLRPAPRQVRADGVIDSSCSGNQGAPAMEPEPAADSLRAPRPEGGRVSASQGAVGQPEPPAEMRNRPAGKGAPAEGRLLSGGKDPAFEPEIRLDGKDRGVAPAEGRPEEAQQTGTAGPGSPESEPKRPPRQEAPPQGGPEPEQARPSGSPVPAPAAAHSGAERAAGEPGVREGAPSLEIAEPEPPQEAARLNGQLDLQVDGSGGERVRIRFAEAPGGVRMRVASNDARLAESLRSEWQTLEAALRRSGWDPQPGPGGSAEAAAEALGGIDGRGSDPGSGADTGDRRAAAQPAEQGERQMAQPGGRQDARQQERNEARQEWLDLSALRRLARRTQA